MGKQSMLGKIREWVGGVAFAIFLWSIKMTQDEYIDALVRDAELHVHPSTEQGGAGTRGIDPDCPNCDGTGGGGKDGSCGDCWQWRTSDKWAWYREESKPRPDRSGGG